MKPYIFAITLCLVSLVTAQAQTTVPAAMTYQGRLTDSNGNPSPDGTAYEVEVRLWTTTTGGTTPIWAARYAGVPVKGGTFNLILGAPGGFAIGGAIADLKTVFATAPTTYLGLTVTKNAVGNSIAGASEIVPRQQLLSSPYAFRAEQAATVDPGSITSVSIKDGEVKAVDIGTGEVLSGNIANQAVTNAKIALGTISSASIASGAITASQLAPNSVQATNIAPGAIGTSHIANGAVGKDQVAALIGAPSTRSFNTVCLAQSDGFVVGNTPSGVENFIVSADANNPPTTVLQSSVSSKSGNTAITFPVRKGTYFQVIASSGSGGVLWFYPLGN